MIWVAAYLAPSALAVLIGLVRAHHHAPHHHADQRRERGKVREGGVSHFGLIKSGSVQDHA